MKKILLTILTLCCLGAYAVSQEAEASENTETSVNEGVQKDYANMFIPIVNFKALQTDEKDFVLTPAVNFQYMRMKNEGVEAKGPDALIISGGYSTDYFTKAVGKDEVQYLHNVNLMGNLGFGKNTFVAMLASGGEVPFSSIHVITLGAMYSRELVKTDNVYFSFGGGIIVADLGLKIGDFNIYVLPLPVFSLSYQNDIVAAGLSMTGMPNASVTLFPKSMFRLNGSVGMAGLSSIRDLTFDCSLSCYPLINTAAGDFLSVSGGVMNNVSGFKLKDNTEFGYQYYSVYGEINATFVTLRGGYNFNGKNRYDGDEVGDMYKGLFASLQMMYFFQ